MNLEEKFNVWQLIQQNKFEEACLTADADYEQSNSVLPLRNKIYALFHLKKYQEVISLTDKIKEIRNGETDSDFISSGIANWILGERTKAIEEWHQAQNCLYKDAAGGIEIQIFLYFAGVKTKQDKLRLAAIKTIKKLLKSKRSTNWPGPLGHCLLNEMSEDEVRSYIADIPVLRERQLCQTHFVSAIKSLEKGDNNEYHNMLEECVSYGAASYLEQTYYMAKGELELVDNSVSN